MTAKDSLRDSWASLGIAFNTNEGLEPVDPETALIMLVKSGEFPEDKKLICLALLWLEHFSKLVHVERLKNMTRSLEAFELAIIGAIARKCVGFGDFRWRTLENVARKSIPPGRGFPQCDSDTFLKLRGTDQDFAAFGVRVAPILPDNIKKLLTRSTIMRRNIWLRNRLLFGSNVRADMATLKILNLADTAYGAAKILGCSNNAAYRNWKDLDEAGWNTPSVAIKIAAVK